MGKAVQANDGRTVYGAVRMDTEIDTTSNGFFDCSSHFYERKNLKCIGVPITSLVIVYFCNDCGSFSSLFNRIHSIRKRKKTSFFFLFLQFESILVNLLKYLIIFHVFSCLTIFHYQEITMKKCMGYHGKAFKGTKE